MQIGLLLENCRGKTFEKAWERGFQKVYLTCTQLTDVTIFSFKHFIFIIVPLRVDQSNAWIFF